MRVHSHFAEEIKRDKQALGIDDAFFRQILTTAHANIHDISVAEPLGWDLQGYRKYRFRHPVTNVDCRYVFAYYPAPNLYKDDVVVPVWLSERSKMGGKYQQVKLRLGITPQR